MAKQIKALKNANDFTAINDYLSQFDEDGDLLEDYVEVEVPEWIHTGSHIFNAFMSGSLIRGIAAGRIFGISGDPKSGKSYLVLNICREAQNMGYFIVFFETEGSPDKERFSKQGVNPNQLRFIQPETVEEVRNAIVQLTTEMKKLKKENKQIPKLLFVIDSLSALNSQKQYDDANAGESKSDMGTIAKLNAEMLKMISVRLARLGYPLIFTQHVYDKTIEGTNHKVKTASGGQGSVYMCSALPYLKKRNDKDKDTKEIKGVEVTATHLTGSRYSKPHEVHLYISLLKGMNPYVGLQDYVSWDICGIDRGKFDDHVDLGYEMWFKKIITKDTAVGFTMTDKFLKDNLAKAKFEIIKPCLEKSIDDGFITITSVGEEEAYTLTEKILERFEEDGKYKKIEERVGIVNKASGQYIIKHLGYAIPPMELFKSHVFTREVLEQLDEKVIRPMFELPDGDTDTDPTGEVVEFESEECVDADFVSNNIVK